MLGLRETHLRILSALLEGEKRLAEKNQLKTRSKRKIATQGVTGFEITKKVSRGTWDANKEFLLYYQLMRISFSKTTGKQERQYYEITPLGALIILKETKSSSYIEFEIVLKQLFKLLGKHWNELSKKFGDQLLFLILKMSVKQIDLIPSDLGNPKTKDSFRRFYGRRLIEKLDLPFDMQETTLSLFRNYTTYSKKDYTHLKRGKFTKYNKNFDEITNSVIERLTFLFYYNILRLKMDPLFMTDFLFSLFIEQKTQKKQKLTSPYISSTHIEDGPLVQEYENWTLKYHKKIMSELDSTFKLIKNDKEISHILKENIEYITKKIESLDSIESIKQELNL